MGGREKVCVCVCVRERVSEKQRERKRVRERPTHTSWVPQRPMPFQLILYYNNAGGPEAVEVPEGLSAD